MMRHALITLALLLGVATLAHSAEFTEGVDYETLAQPQPVITGDKIEVRELFWYGCPHCYALEPTLEHWRQDGIPTDAEFVPYPAVLSNGWAFDAQAYFTFEALGITGKAHRAFFDALHKEKQDIHTPEALADWTASMAGLDKQAVLDAFNSFAVDTNMNQARVLVRGYQISGVPTLIVDGKYRTSPSMVDSEQKVFEVVNFLVAKAAAERDK